jgi:hypothetical protein
MLQIGMEVDSERIGLLSGAGENEVVHVMLLDARLTHRASPVLLDALRRSRNA